MIDELDRRSFLGLTAASVTAVLSGCLRGPEAVGWRMAGYDAANTRYNPASTAPEGVEPEENRIWSYTVSSSSPNGLDTSIQAVGPAVVDDVAYAGGVRGNFHAIDVESGDELWKYGDGQGFPSFPAVIDDTVYVGSRDNHLHAVDTKTGEESWKYDAGEMIQTAPVIDDGVIYTVSDQLHAVDVDMQEKLWSFEHSSLVYSPAVEDGVIYVPGPGLVFKGNEVVDTPQDNMFFALDAVSGEWLWSSEMDVWVEGEPVAGDEHVFAADRRTGLKAFDSVTGELEWFLDMDSPSHHGLAYAESTVYVSSSEGTWAVDASTGEVEWRNPVAEGSIAIADDKLYLSHRESFHILERGSGELIQKQRRTGSFAAGPPVIAYDNLYIASWYDIRRYDRS